VLQGNMPWFMTFRLSCIPASPPGCVSSSFLYRGSTLAPTGSTRAAGSAIMPHPELVPRDGSPVFQLPLLGTRASAWR
jgi:hypothetical protein